jgi:hypothetical protein
MLVKTYSSTVFGINATTITIEVNLEIGINFYLVVRLKLQKFNVLLRPYYCLMYCFLPFLITYLPPLGPVYTASPPVFLSSS